MLSIEDGLARRCYLEARGDRWRVPFEQFTAALARSAARGLSDGPHKSREIERYLTSLHLADLALACACAAGDADAWDHFVREYRPALHRTANALDPAGGAHDLADGLYAELFGLNDRDGDRQSLFRYFHGRSSLATWLRAVLAQRLVDRVRSGRRVEALPEDESAAALRSPAAPPDPEREPDLRLMRTTLAAAIAALAPADRLRLRCYYGQGLTLAEIGRLLGEHEATASRQLSRVRQTIRADVERRLREDAGLTDAQVARCVATASDDAGPLDVGTLLAEGAGRKESSPTRSMEEKAR